MEMTTCKACKGKGCAVCNDNGWYCLSKCVQIFDPDYVFRPVGGQAGIKHRFNDAEKNIIISMYEEGYTQHEIAEHMECCHKRISRLLKQNKVKIRYGKAAHIAAYKRRKRDETI